MSSRRTTVPCLQSVILFDTRSACRRVLRLSSLPALHSLLTNDVPFLKILIKAMVVGSRSPVQLNVEEELRVVDRILIHLS
jgi:hypothetical protein